jgi:hypothetical protein
MDLVEFLRARIDEVAQRAERAADRWDDEDVRYEWEDLPDDVFAHARTQSPVRVLAEVEAKRLFLADHDGVHRCDWGEHRGADHLGWCTTLKRLALPYADHPDFDEDWKP